MKSPGDKPETFALDKVKIYDVAKKALLKECLSTAEAATFLGISHQHVVTAIKQKSKVRKNALGIVVAIR